MVSDGLIAHGGFEGAAERVLAENSDDQWAIFGGKSLWGPIGELRKVEKEGRLDLVFSRDRRFGSGYRRGEPEQEQEREHASKGAPGLRTVAMTF